jgi:hypothetical protein
MDLSKLTLGEKVMAGSGIALVIFLFFPWYGVDVLGRSASYNGWHYFLFGLIPGLLALAIIAVIAVTRFSTTKMPDLPIALGLALLIAAGLAAFLVVIKLLIGDSYFGFHLTRKFGVFLSALAALGLAGGAFLKFREEGGATTPGRGSTGGPTTPF